MDDKDGSKNNNNDIQDLSERLLNWQLRDPYHDREQTVRSLLASVSSHRYLNNAPPPQQQLGHQDSGIEALQSRRSQSRMINHDAVPYYPRQLSSTAIPLFASSSSSSYSHVNRDYPYAQFHHQHNYYEQQVNNWSHYYGSSSRNPNPSDYQGLPSSSSSIFSATNNSYSGSGLIQSNFIRDLDHRPRRRGLNNQNPLQISRSYSPPEIVELKSLEQVRGRIAWAARDQNKCPFLRERLRKGRPDEVEVIFSETMAELFSLAVHPFGNYLVQTLIAVAKKDKLRAIVAEITSSRRCLRNICTDDYGSKVIAALIEGLEENRSQQSLLLLNLSEFAVVLCKTTNCKQLLDTIFTECLYAIQEPFLNVIAENFIDIATDKNGCCVLQTCLGVCYEQLNDSTDSVFSSCVSDVITNAHFLSQHPYGNYVVQFVIGLHNQQINGVIAAELRGRLVSLSMNKHGSNVVQKLIAGCEVGVSEGLIVELTRTPHLLQLFQDNYGNYVIQTAIKTAQSNGLEILRTLLDFMENNINSLTNHPHGRSVLRHRRGNRNNRRS